MAIFYKEQHLHILVFSAITLGIYNFKFGNYKSDNTEKNKCTAEKDASACIESCTGGRTLLNGFCKCNFGTYDDGSNNQCIICHYSWFHCFLSNIRF